MPNNNSSSSLPFEQVSRGDADKPQYNEKRYAVMLIALIAAVVVLACAVLITSPGSTQDNTADLPQPDDVTIAPEFSQEAAEVAVPLGESAELVYTGDISGFASSDESIVTVEDGVLHGVALGEATVTADAPDGSSLEWTVTVKKVAYLTIDDWPGENTAAILDILDEYNIKATFFLCAEKTYHDMYQRIIDDGHTFANHTYSHRTDVIYESSGAFFNTVHTFEDWALENFGADTNKFLRFPTGSSSDGNQEKYTAFIYLERDGYRIYDWTSTFGDAASTATAESCFANVKETCTEEREIILMHHKAHSAEALPQIIEYLTEQGYMFAPLTPTSPVYNFHNGWVLE